MYAVFPDFKQGLGLLPESIPYARPANCKISPYPVAESSDSVRAIVNEPVGGTLSVTGSSAAIFPGATVLEAGCGFSTMFAAEYKRAGKVIGVDIDDRGAKQVDEETRISF